MVLWILFVLMNKAFYDRIVYFVTDRERPDYAAADRAVSTITELMPQLVKGQLSFIYLRIWLSCNPYLYLPTNKIIAR